MQSRIGGDEFAGNSPETGPTQEAVERRDRLCLGLVLLGGLTAAHGGSTGQAWEISAGLLLVVIGAVLLVMKIVRRNTAHSGPTSR
jgi:hypothetical protein